MAQHWQFTQDEQEQWHWTLVDESAGPTESPDAFATPVDCFLDAVRHVVRARRPDSGPDQTH